MLSFLYKERITKMYNDGMSITEISKTLGVRRLTPKTVKELLVKWNIPLRYANGQFEKDMYISYVGVYDKENDGLMKVFKHKWKVIRWLKEVGIIEGNLTNSQLSYYIKKKMIIRDQVYFKKISEELYEEYKIEGNHEVLFD